MERGLAMATQQRARGSPAPRLRRCDAQLGLGRWVGRQTEPFWLEPGAFGGGRSPGVERFAELTSHP